MPLSYETYEVVGWRNGDYYDGVGGDRGAARPANLARLSLHPAAEAEFPQASRDPSAQLKRHAWRLAGDRIRDKRLFFSVGPRSSRVFNNCTSLPKVLRRHALLDGRHCVEIDICNSQTFFLAALYPPNSAERPRFAAVVAAGIFYEFVNETACSPYERTDRKALKDAVLVQVLFGRWPARSPLWAGFSRSFPELARIILERKDRDYRQLPIDLQRIEARIMIHRVVPCLAEELPEIPILTIHDSLIIDERHVEQAAAVIRRCTKEATGLVPSLRTTPSRRLA